MASKKERDSVWEKADSIRGKNPDVYRTDTCGNKIRHASYGTKGAYGWEIDHKNPLAKGGSDALRNKQPLHWRENREKALPIPIRKNDDY